MQLVGLAANRGLPTSPPPLLQRVIQARIRQRIYCWCNQRSCAHRALEALCDHTGASCPLGDLAAAPQADPPEFYSSELLLPQALQEPEPQGMVFKDSSGWLTAGMKLAWCHPHEALWVHTRARETRGGWSSPSPLNMFIRKRKTVCVCLCVCARMHYKSNSN